MGSTENELDPCAEFGPTQKAATVWFFLVITIGIAMTYSLSRIDRGMYDTNSETLDYDQYRSNRFSQYGLPSDGSDSRKQNSLPLARQ